MGRFTSLPSIGLQVVALVLADAFLVRLCLGPSWPGRTLWQEIVADVAMLAFGLCYSLYAFVYIVKQSYYPPCSLRAVAGGVAVLTFHSILFVMFFRVPPTPELLKLFLATLASVLLIDLVVFGLFRRAASGVARRRDCTSAAG